MRPAAATPSGQDRPSLDWATRWAVDVDYADRYALVATAGRTHAIIAHGAYMRIDEKHAEVAFVVADAWQGHGIATILLSRLAVAAEDHGSSASAPPPDGLATAAAL